MTNRDRQRPRYTDTFTKSQSNRSKSYRPFDPHNGASNQDSTHSSYKILDLTAPVIDAEVLEVPIMVVHGPILILVPIRGTKDDCCELIAHKVEIENLYDNLSAGVAFKLFFSCKSAGNDL